MPQLSKQALGLSDDYGSASNVVRMRPGAENVPQAPQPAPAPAPEPAQGSAPEAGSGHDTDYGGPSYGNFGGKVAVPGHEGAYEMNDDPNKVSAGEALRGAFNPGQKAYNKEQKARAKAGRQQQRAETSAQRDQNRAAGRNEPVRRPASGTSGGYAYLQYPDGSIKVIETPTGQGIGTTYHSQSQAAANVRAEFGPYPTNPVERALDPLFQGIGQGLKTFMDSPDSAPPHEEPEKSNTALYVGIGVGVLALTGLAVWAFTRDSDD